MIHNYASPDWVEIAANIRLDQEPQKLAAVKSICADIMENQMHYNLVREKTGVPMLLIGAIHYRESSLNFNTMLHNGEPLNRKSRIVPIGVGPFATWEDAAIDALKGEGCMDVKDWSFANCMAFAEKFNGRGYRKRGIYSPYVVSFTNMSDEIGGFPSDGVYSKEYVNKRPGVAALILGLIGKYDAS